MVDLLNNLFDRKAIEMWRREGNNRDVVVVVKGKQKKCGGGNGRIYSFTIHEAEL